MMPVPDNLPCYSISLSFAYESSGIETFLEIGDLEALSRRVFVFNQPEILYEWLSENDILRIKKDEI